jgi:hypothetical protein
VFSKSLPKKIAKGSIRDVVLGYAIARFIFGASIALALLIGIDWVALDLILTISFISFVRTQMRSASSEEEK